MKCPNCGYGELLPIFKCCPVCCSLLSKASEVPENTETKEQKEVTRVQRADAGKNGAFGVDHGVEIRGNLTDLFVTVYARLITSITLPLVLNNLLVVTRSES